RLTCEPTRKRKVKCDETKPQCLRCIKTGRKCDGYTAPPPGSYSWRELLGKQPILPAITSRRNSQDGRAMDFYHSVVAPAFSRFPGDDFWTRMVAQASLQEPAVHHAVVAISNFYELADGTPFDTIIATPKGRYAVMQYNQALQELTKMRDEAVVLFVCILFICIEALRDNKEGAMTHVRYGIRVFNGSEGGGTTWARDYFRPIFTRLLCCPFFFGASIVYFPAPVGYDTEDVSGPHESWDICRYRIDVLTTRCIRFVREYEVPPGSTTPLPTHIPPKDVSNMNAQRNRLVLLLDEWLANYDVLYAEQPPPADNLAPFLMMVMECLVLRTWVLACGAQDEMVYDQYLETFREIVDLARQAAAVEKKKIEMNQTPLHKSKFTLDMGFVPTLYFVVIKCRDLSLRQAALYYMTVLAPERENLWNTSLLYSVGTKIIELEHGEASKRVVTEPNEQNSEPRMRIFAGSLPVKTPADLEKGLGPLPEAPPSDVRVRDALCLRDPDVRLPGKGLGTLPHRPTRVVIGPAVPPAVTEGGTPAAVSTAGNVELPLTPPDEFGDGEFLETESGVGTDSPGESVVEV
ncbi:hypothetical protein B0T16DRAFT_328113, partial [Cercophora newfieldiana]